MSYDILIFYFGNKTVLIVLRYKGDMTLVPYA